MTGAERQPYTLNPKSELLCTLFPSSRHTRKPSNTFALRSRRAEGTRCTRACGSPAASGRGRSAAWPSGAWPPAEPAAPPAGQVRSDEGGGRCVVPWARGQCSQDASVAVMPALTCSNPGFAELAGQACSRQQAVEHAQPTSSRCSSARRCRSSSASRCRSASSAASLQA